MRLIDSLAMRCIGKVVVVVLAVSVVLSQGACTLWKEPAVATWKNTTSLEAMERLLWQEIKAGNWVEVEAHLASNFTASTAARVLDKSQAIARWKALPNADFALGEIAVTDNGDTSVLTYNLAHGAGAPERRVSVWQKQKNGWLMIAHAEGPAAVPAR